MALFPETAVTDTAGETITRTEAVGVIAKAVVEPIPPDAASEPQPVSIPRYRLRLVSDTPPAVGLAFLSSDLRLVAYRRALPSLACRVVLAHSCPWHRQCRLSRSLWPSTPPCDKVG